METIRAELARFLASRNISTNYDFFIAVERKAMAIVRALVEAFGDQQLSLRRDQLLSNAAIHHMGAEIFEGKRVLVFDDTEFAGTTLTEVKKSLLEKNATVTTAAFLVHQDCPPSLMADCWYYRNLDNQDYHRKRRELLQFLHSTQQLLLDTEHMAIRFNLPTSAGELEKVLLKLGNLLHIPSPFDTGSTFLTQHKPPFFDVSRIGLPQGSGLTLDPCKDRWIIGQNRFWIIPIVFPSVPESFDTDSCPLRQDPKSLPFCKFLTFPPANDTCFHCVALRSSAELLSSTLVTLKSHINTKLEVAEIPVCHLRALFPFLDVKTIEEWVSKTVSEAIGTQERLVPFRGSEIPLPDDFQSNLLEVLRLTCKEGENWAVRLETPIQDRPGKQVQKGVSFESLYRRLSYIAEEEVSRCLDVLIDQAILCPMVLCEKGRRKRGIRIDGEFTFRMVSQMVSF